MSANNSLTQFQVSPNQLVFLAYQGHFVNQGIPSYGSLVNAHASGKITSKDLVNAAILTDFLEIP